MISKKYDVDYFKETNLLPHQTEFAIEFLNKSNLFWNIVSPTGAGKTYLACYLLIHELINNTHKKSLVITTKSLLSQWKYTIDQINNNLNIYTVHPKIFSKNEFLEFKSEYQNNNMKSINNNVVIMSVDTAKIPYVRNELLKIKWDLIILDEIHLYKSGMRKTLYENILSLKKKTLVLSSLSTKVDDNFITKIYKISDIIDWNQNKIFSNIERKLFPIIYERTNDEIEIFTYLEKLLDLISSFSDISNFRKYLFVKMASSSLFMLGNGLLRFQNYLLSNDQNIILNYFDETIDNEMNDLKTNKIIINNNNADNKKYDGIEHTNNINEYIDEILYKLDEIQFDSKLDSVINFIKNNYNENRIFIICNFVSTIEYIFNSIAELDIPVYYITGSMNYESRIDNLHKYIRDGGVLISSNIMITHSIRTPSDYCILYDLPNSNNNLEQIWGKFSLYRKKDNFKMLYLKDNLDTLEYENKIINAFKKF